MSHVLTLVASDPENRPLNRDLCRQVETWLAQRDAMMTCAPVDLQPGQAVDIGVAEPLPAGAMQDLQKTLREARVDCFCLPVDGRRKKLLIADMDSTIVTSETLDDLSEFAGIKHIVAEITARAMNGEIDFQEALRERVKLLKDLPEENLRQAGEEIRLSRGARELVTTMRAAGATCILVTGGFTYFAGMVATRAGFHKFHGNVLEIVQGKLTGKVNEPILDKSAKLQILMESARETRTPLDRVMAIGDGANDLPMLERAGFGVGYHPKPLLRGALCNQILHGDLTAALYAQGYNAARIRDMIAMMGD